MSNFYFLQAYWFRISKGKTNMIKTKIIKHQKASDPLIGRTRSFLLPPSRLILPSSPTPPSQPPPPATTQDWKCAHWCVKARAGLALSAWSSEQLFDASSIYTRRSKIINELHLLRQADNSAAKCQGFGEGG